MTRDEFEAGYAARSGITVEELRALGRKAVSCCCDSDMCQGWAMAPADDLGQFVRDPGQEGQQ